MNSTKENNQSRDTAFEDILDLFNLDRDIRHVTLGILLDIECIFYSSLAYCLSDIYGEKQDDYLNKRNYRLGRKQKYNNRYERDNLLWKIGKKINEPDEQPL